MRRLIFTIPLLLLLSACGKSIIQQAEGDVRAKLEDPDSAVFTRVRIADKLKASDRTMVCGLVNAKSSDGGYSGARRFLVDVSGDVVLMEPQTQHPTDRYMSDIEDLSHGLFERGWAMAQCRLSAG